MPITRQYDNWIEAYQAYRHDKEPPHIYNEWVAVSVIASVLQRKCWIQWDTKVFPNFYVVLVGPSGVRKSSAMYPGKRMLSDLGITISADSVTREQLIVRIHESESVDSDPLTGETLIHSSLTIFASELAVFLSARDGTLFSDLTDLFDCPDKWVRETKTQGSQNINGVWLNLIGATTPELLKDILTEVTIGGGLSSRIIFVYARDKSNIDPFPNDTAIEERMFQNLRDDLSAIRLCKGQYVITDSFRELYGPWYIEMENTQKHHDPWMEPYFSRRSTHLRKLCMVFSAARSNSMEITDLDFNRALDLLTRTEDHMFKAYDKVGQNKNLVPFQRIVDMLRKSGELTTEQIVRATYRDCSDQELQDILSQLLRSKTAKMEKNAQGQSVLCLLDPGV